MPGGTSAPAPTNAPAPMRAPSNTVARMAISAPSSTVQPCTTAPWPMVTLAPTTHGKLADTWRIAPSCTLVRSPTVTGATSPRMTAPNQTLTCSPSVTAPRTVAVSAIHAVGGTVGSTRVHARHPGALGAACVPVQQLHQQPHPQGPKAPFAL